MPEDRIMSAHHPELSDDEQLLDLLRLIVTRHPSALSTIDTVFKHSPHLANSTLTFTFKENGSRSEHQCRCHYEHEYMTYISDTGIDFESFSHMAKNVVRGQCRHAADSPTPGPTTPISPPFSDGKDLTNIRRYSVDFELVDHNYIEPKRRIVKRRSSSSLKALDINDSGRGTPTLTSPRSCTSLRSLVLEIDEVVCKTQTSLIHAAAAVGDASLLVFLMKSARVSLQQLGKFQLSPLHMAIMKHKMCHLSNIILVSDTYLTNKAGTFIYGEVTTDDHKHKTLVTSKLSLIGLCVKANDMETMKQLLNSGVMRDVALEKGLKEAVEGNSVEAVETLFRYGVRPSLDIMKVATTRSVTVFESVFRRFRKDFKIYSLQHPERITQDLLMPAILTRNYGVVEILIQNGAPTTSKGFYTPLTLAVLENQPEVADLLLQRHADRAIELQGCNLLDISSCLGFTECSNVLKRHGLRRKIRHMKTTVPCNLLIGIAKKLDLPVDALKLRRQLELKHYDIGGDTVLHFAVKTKLSPNIVGELLRMGSDVNARNKRLETPLMCAVSSQVAADPEVIRELLYYNPILELSDKYGNTTLAMAMTRDHNERSGGSRNGNSTDAADSVANLLLDCGYNVMYDDVKKPHHTVYALRAVWKDLAATIGCGRDGMYIQQNPKSLKSRCREVVRRCHPGIKLHRFLEVMRVPPEINDFVLMVDFLRK